MPVNELNCPSCNAIIDVTSGNVTQCPSCGLKLHRPVKAPTHAGTEPPSVEVPATPASVNQAGEVFHTHGEKKIQKVGPYRLINLIGKGGMGVVYLGEHSTLGRKVGIKFLPERYSGDPYYVERFIREARSAAFLHHPNIITVHDAGSVDEDVHYIVMEYVQGQDLAQMLDAGQVFPEEKALNITKTAAAALAYAHEHGLIHRDIKPGNLMLTPSDQLKMGDLGLAIRTDNPDEQSREVIGTPSYMSPEQICNPYHVDARADIYSLGATLYHLVTGFVPYPGQTVEDILEMQTKMQLTPPRKVHPELSEETSQLIMKMMSKDATERFQSMNDVVAAIQLIEKRKLDPSAPASGDKQAVALERTMLKLKKGLEGGGSNFPSIIGPMNVISKLSQTGSNVSIDELTDSILSDIALTNKLLKLVNSAFYSTGYSTGGEKITTISRAILVLGYAQLRSAALSLTLFQNMESGRKQPLKEIKEMSVNNFLSGILAKNLAGRIGGIDREEAFICSIFYNLGKLITTFYLIDEKHKVDERVRKDGVHEQIASQSLLGISYEDLGVMIAEQWNFPEKIVSAMKRPPTMPVPIPTTAIERLRSLAAFSNELCALLRQLDTPPEKMEMLFQDLLQNFAKCFTISPEDLAESIQQSLNTLVGFTQLLGFDVDTSSFIEVESVEKKEDQAAEST
jgi:eukaryotic-like serine/threonine-protein kinase